MNAKHTSYVNVEIPQSELTQAVIDQVHSINGIKPEWRLDSKTGSIISTEEQYGGSHSWTDRHEHGQATPEQLKAFEVIAYLEQVQRAYKKAEEAEHENRRQHLNSRKYAADYFAPPVAV